MPILLMKQICFLEINFIFRSLMNGGKTKEYIDYLSFMITRDKTNKTRNSWNNQAVLLRDKFLFYKYMKSNNLPVPDVFAVLNDDKIYDSNYEPFSLESLIGRRIIL